MTPLLDSLRDALVGPSGRRDLLPDVLRAVLARQIDPAALPPAPGAAPHAALDAMLRHLADGPWFDAFLALDDTGSGHEDLLVLGFRDAPLDAVRALVSRGWIVTERLLAARDDRADDLVALFESLQETPAAQPALTAALARERPVRAGLEDAWTLTNLQHLPLARAAFENLGPARTDAVVARVLVRFDDQPEFRHEALIPLLMRVGPWFDETSIDRIFARAELLGDGYMAWEEWGARLAASGETAFVLAQLDRRAASLADPALRDGWRRAARSLLDRAVSAGFALEPAHDASIDPAGAARLNHDAWSATLRLLRAIPLARAEAALDGAFERYEHPSDCLRFVMKGLSDAHLARVAAAIVAVRDDAARPHLLRGTNLRPYGPGLVDGLQVALADVLPKRAFLTSLERNLEAADYARLAAWLETRPPPKRGGKKK